MFFSNSELYFPSANYSEHFRCLSRRSLGPIVTPPSPFFFRSSEILTSPSFPISFSTFHSAGKEEGEKIREFTFSPSRSKTSKVPLILKDGWFNLGSIHLTKSSLKSQNSLRSRLVIPRKVCVGRVKSAIKIESLKRLLARGGVLSLYCQTETANLFPWIMNERFKCSHDLICWLTITFYFAKILLRRNCAPIFSCDAREFLCPPLSLF